MKKRDKKKVVVIIPARGGSKRFKDKNLSKLRGKPLLDYPIKAARKANLVDRVVVSTDSKKIESIAKKCGAEVPFIRPKHLSGDSSAVVDTLIYTVKRLEKDYNYKPDYIILLQATTPLINSMQINKAVRKAVKENADSVITVSEVNTINHPYNIREINKKGYIHFWKNREHYKYAGKKRPKFYHAANLWLSSYDTLIKKNKLEGKKNYHIILEPIYSMDIDYKEDLELIEAYLKDRNNKQF